MTSPQFEALKQIIAQRPQAERGVQEIRDATEEMAKLFPLAADIKNEKVGAGGVPAEWVWAPNSDPSTVVLYLHGGGYIVGSMNTHRELASRICRAAGARALLIDYRLAPENPFPAALEDSEAAYRWLLRQGVKPKRIIIAGDSAGGGLTVATLVALRDAGTAMPGAAVLMSAWTDMKNNGDSMTTKAEVDPIVQKKFIDECSNYYMQGGDMRTPLASPIHADLRGLPPLLIQVGECETLLDDSTRLAERAKASGADVTLQVWPEMIHVWQSFAPMLPEGQQAIDSIGEWVREKLGAVVSS